MAQKRDSREIVTFKEMLTANSVMVDALAQLLIEKQIITEEEFMGKLKEVQADYRHKSYNAGEKT